jgi:hypothetical protein
VVACFKPEWNSLDVNKIRSFNILRGNFSAPDAQDCCIEAAGGKGYHHNRAEQAVKFS